jgi:pimeloyl-ACP methyl ester carboxylesterase
MDQANQKCVRFAESWVTVDVYGEDDGSALVLIPGVMADSAAWAEVARGLQGWETVAVVNRRGREPSGPLTGDYDLRREVQDAEAILRRFSDVQTLFGWSYGGTIAPPPREHRPRSACGRLRTDHGALRCCGAAGPPAARAGRTTSTAPWTWRSAG